MIYKYTPHGVCSTNITVELENEIIKKVRLEGGCSGNAKGIAALLEGMPAREAISRLKGTRCGAKQTSCPDQLSIALENAIKAEGEK